MPVPFCARRREHDLRAEEAHQLAPLDAEVLGHRRRRADSPCCAQTIARPMPVLPLVASITVWPGFERAAALGVLDDAEREPVLDRAHRIERLDLDVELDVRRRELVDAHDRRAADRSRGCCRTWPSANPSARSRVPSDALSIGSIASTSSRQHLVVERFPVGSPRARARSARAGRRPGRPLRRA